ncbi:hypothetical protein SELMODRAFT_415073 [Selaginella moellendorffii]|uniref:Uncharacterized protein n=1 Tax=Selaginella moellendorffii TaxID=88036 RepID=D8RUX7_SELML|nr:hypothetical protein SELMODRAFT_415073 [Selaginella moellendorffii]
MMCAELGFTGHVVVAGPSCYSGMAAGRENAEKSLRASRPRPLQAYAASIVFHETRLPYLLYADDGIGHLAVGVGGHSLRHTQGDACSLSSSPSSHTRWDVTNQASLRQSVRGVTNTQRGHFQRRDLAGHEPRGPSNRDFGHHSCASLESLRPGRFLNAFRSGRCPMEHFDRGIYDILPTRCSSEDIVELLMLLINLFKLWHFVETRSRGLSSRAPVVESMDIAKSAGALLSYDPNLRLPLMPTPEDARIGILSIWNKADLIKISEEELEFLTNGADQMPYLLHTTGLGRLEVEELVTVGKPFDQLGSIFHGNVKRQKSGFS